MAPQFSVVIPTFDRPDLLRRAVGSVLAQTVASFEVIVVDDASPRPPELPPDPRIRLIVHDANAGPAGARNTGIAAAAGDFVLFLDDDDEYTPRRLAIAAAGLHRAPVAACSKRFVSADGLVVERSATGDVDHFLASRWLHVGQLAIRRDLVPRFDDRFLTSEDHEWAIRVVRRARPWPVDEVGYIVADHPGVHASGRDMGQLFADRVRMLERHADFFASRPDLLAWQWKLLGGRALVSGQRRLARQAFLRSLAANPTPRTAAHLVRTFLVRPRPGVRPSPPSPASHPAARVSGEPKLISVVVPAYNAAATLPVQLEALSQQTYSGNWEVILSDNGSTDDSIEVARAFAGRLPSLRVVAATGALGVSHARNAGVAAAAGDFVAICDADDRVDTGWLAGLSEAAPNGHVVGGMIDLAGLNGPRRHWQAHTQVSGSTAELPRLLGFLPFAPGGNFGAWRSVIGDLGGWDERLVAGCDDVDFSWRAQLAGFRVVAAPQAIVSVRTRATARAHARQSFRFGVTTAQLYANYRRYGAEAPQLRSTVRTWAWLLATMPALLHDEQRGFWLRLAATRAGRLVGSAKYRVLLT